MRAQGGVALATALVLLLVLCVLTLSGARLGAVELRDALASEQRIALHEQAQSLIDAALSDGEARPGLSIQDVDLPDLPPLPGSGYSADRFTMPLQRLSATPAAGTRVDEWLARLRPATVVAGPRLGSDCAPAESAARHAKVRVGAAVETLELRASGTTFVARRESGEVLWSETHRLWRDAAVAGVTLLDADADGAVDRMLVGDTGGALWRADLAGPVENWRVTLLAQTGSRITAAADIVQARDAQGRYDAVVVSADDALLLVRDRNLSPGSGTDAAGPYEGWRAAMRAGEHLRAAPLTIANVIYFAAWSAGAAATCEDGTDQVYAASLASGAPRPLGPAFAGAPVTLDYAGPAPVATPQGPRCGVRLAAAAQFFDVPGCTRFRGAWMRAGS